MIMCVDDDENCYVVPSIACQHTHVKSQLLSLVIKLNRASTRKDSSMNWVSQVKSFVTSIYRAMATKPMGDIAGTISYAPHVINSDLV